MFPEMDPMICSISWTGIVEKLSSPSQVQVSIQSMDLGLTLKSMTDRQITNVFRSGLGTLTAGRWSSFL